MRVPLAHARLRPLHVLTATLITATSAQAQFVFSTEYTSASVSLPDGFGGVPITESDLLTPTLGVPALGPLPTPGIDVSGGASGLGLALHPLCVGHPPASPCGVELDAVSYGRDRPASASLGFASGEIWFSVDALAVGIPSFPPDVSTESPCSDSAADLYSTVVGAPPGPLAPFAGVLGHTAVVDGDGMAGLCPTAYPGIGLIEPSLPVLPPTGDNLDAVEIGPATAPGGTGFPPIGVYFSLDGVLTHPATGIPSSGSAAAHGFFGADVLHSATPGGPPVLFAAAPMLGLNISGALDDLDALALFENGSGVFEPSLTPYDWLTGSTDMLLFSVRAGSPVIGLPDSIFGLPISEGDILTTPMVGGFSPLPGIFIAAENLGLVTTRSFGIPNDDLNALDTVFTYSHMPDCNSNGIHDMIDITTGFSSDVNGNFVPDECEVIGGPSCFCDATVAPCVNPYATGGCANSAGLGAILSASGSGSVTLDNLVMTAIQLPPNKPGLLFSGTTLISPLPFGDGLRCAGGTIKRLTGVLVSDSFGTMVGGPGLATANSILPGSTRHIQCWYRDAVHLPCSSKFNTSNVFSVTFTP